VSPDSQIALAVIGSLDDHALDLLAARLGPRLRDQNEPVRRPAAYTVATLADELGLSQRTVRGAIDRGELAAVKRGSRWLVSAEAVAAWVAPAQQRAPVAPRARIGAPAKSSLADLAAQIDRAESEQMSNESDRPPVPLEHKPTKVTPATRQRPGVVGQRRVSSHDHQ
jgi:excisionase family DNA binding protein